MHKMKKVLFAALIASSFFLCQTVRADSSQPPSETSESQIQESQEPLDSSHTPPNEADPSDSTRWEKLEQQRKELEDTLEQAKQQLIEKQKEIDQTVNDLANQAVSDRDELAEKIAEEREKAELAKQKIASATQRATEVQTELQDLATSTVASVDQTQADIQAARTEIHEKAAEAQATMADFEVRKADLSAGIERIKATLHSAGKRSVEAGTVTKTVTKTETKVVEEQPAKTLPKTDDRRSIYLSVIGSLCLLVVFVGAVYQKRV